MHKCNEDCVCPIHKTPLYYSPAGNDHACQDSNCVYSGGMKVVDKYGDS